MSHIESLLAHVVRVTPIGPAGLALSSALWVVVYFAAQLVTSNACKRSRGALNAPKRDAWDNYAMAWCHNLVAFAGAAAVTFSHLPSPSNSVAMWRFSTPLAEFVVQLTLAFILVDTVFVLFKWNSIGGVDVLIHHLIFPLSYGLGLYATADAAGRPFGVFLMLVFQLGEISTPFLHQRWFFANTGMKGSVLDTLNNVYFTLTFLGIRGVFMTFVMAQIWASAPHPLYWPGCFKCSIVMQAGIVFQLLQYFWCFKVLSGAIALLTRSGKVVSDGVSSQDASGASKKQG
jgi:hypothetical protein